MQSLLINCPQKDVDVILNVLYFKCNLGIDILSIQVNITQEWMAEDLIDGKSALVKVMAPCHKATTHYPNQCSPRFLSPYILTRA